MGLKLKGSVTSLPVLGINEIKASLKVGATDEATQKFPCFHDWSLAGP